MRKNAHFTRPFGFQTDCHSHTVAKQIDVMVLYSPESLPRVVGGVTAEQMETLIADELPAATEAGVNSEISVNFNLVHTAVVSGSRSKMST